MQDDIIEKLAQAYLRQQQQNETLKDAMRIRHLMEYNNLMEVVENGPNNPWTTAFHETGIEKTDDIVERVAKRLRNASQNT